MAMRGPNDTLAVLVKRLRDMPQATDKAIASCVPTLEKLLSGASRDGTVEPRHWDGADDKRRYEVDDFERARIDENTVVKSDGSKLTVDATGDPHLRPIIPLGDELPLKWHRALAARANGTIRRELAAGTGGPKGEP